MAHFDYTRSKPNDFWIHQLISSDVDISQFLNRYRIARAPQCPTADCDAQCISVRILSNRELSRNRLPFRWKCSRNDCNGSLPFLYGSYLDGTRLSLGKQICLIYKYFTGRNAKESAKELDIGYLTVTRYFRFYRRCISHYMQHNFYVNFQFNINYAIQWDEAAFVKKQKHHRGNTGIHGGRRAKWVLGGVQEQTNYVALKYVLRRDALTLQSFIAQQCPMGATVVTDCWRGYNGLNQRGFMHWNVNHEQGFVHPLSGYHTNMIEGLWQLVRGEFRKYRGMREEELQWFLDEFAFKRNMRLSQEGLWVKLLLVIGAKQSVVSLD